MDIHLFPHFPQFLYIVSFFKSTAPSADLLLPESIRLASPQQIFFSIEEDQFQTLVVKDMLCFLLEQLSHLAPSPAAGVPSVFTLLNGNLEPYRSDTIAEFYLPLALQQSFYKDQDEQKKQQLRKVKQFCKIERQTKYELLYNLVRSILGSKGFRKETEELDAKDSEQNPNSKERPVLKEIVVLGEDDKELYFYIPFLPNLIYSRVLKKWNAYNRCQILKKIEELIKLPKSSSLLQLIERLMYLVEFYLPKKEQENTKMPRILKAKSPFDPKQKVKKFKQILLDFEARYSATFQIYNNRRYAPVWVRKQFVKKIKDSSNLDNLIAAYGYFFEHTQSYYYSFKAGPEDPSLTSSNANFYEKIKSKKGTIHYLSIVVQERNATELKQTTKSLLKGNRFDTHALFQTIVLGLESPLRYLEIRAERFQKQKTSRNQQSLIRKNMKSSMSLSETSLSFEGRRESSRIRDRKAKNRNRRVIDSDQSDEEQSKPESALRNQFSRYELRRI